MLLNPFTLYSPTTLSDAANLYAQLDHVKIQAGGTFLLSNLKLLKKKRIKTPEHIINLSKIEELKEISEANGVVTIKAMVPISDLLISPALTDNCAVLKLVARNISTTPIRNMATVGGNLTCRYTWTEMPATMIGLGAEMYFISTQGTEERMTAEEFFKNKAKTQGLFTHLTIKKDATAMVSYQRVKKSPHVDVPMISLLMTTTLKDKKFTNTRVAVNNGADFALRDRKLEEFLNKNSWTETLAEDVWGHCDQAIYTARSTAYKTHMFQVCLKKAVKELGAKA